VGIVGRAWVLGSVCSGWGSTESVMMESVIATGMPGRQMERRGKEGKKWCVEVGGKSSNEDGAFRQLIVQSQEICKPKQAAHRLQYYKSINIVELVAAPTELTCRRRSGAWRHGPQWQSSRYRCPTRCW